MAGPVLSIVGGIVAGPVGSFVGLMAGKWIDFNVLGLGPQRSVQEGPRLESLQVQVSSYGVPIKRLYGTMRLAGNIIWARPLREQRITDEISGGCYAPDTEVIEYAYYGTFAIGLCRGPIEGILRIWADTKLIYDNLTTNHDVVSVPGLSFTVYLGDESQTADPLMESFEGTGNVPGHRGLAYVVFDDLPLAEFGNRIPNLTFEVTTNLVPAQPYDEIPELALASSNEDDLRVDPTTRAYVVLHTSGTWTRIDIRTGEILKQVDNGDIGDANAGWDYDGAFYIYVAAPTGEDDIYTLRRISASSLQAMTAVGEEIAEGIRQVTYGDRPLGITTSPDTARVILGLSVTGTPTFYRFLPWHQDPGFTYELPAAGHMIAPRATNITPTAQLRAYVICSDGVSAGTTYIVRFVGTVATTFNITANIQDGDRICYDPTSNQVIVGSTATGALAFFDGDTLAHLATIASVVGDHMVSEFKRGPVDGYLWLGNGTTLRKINVATHAVSATYTLPLTKTAGAFYDSLTHSYWYGASAVTPSGGFVRVCLDRVAGEGEALSDVVTAICAELGVESSQIDVSALTGDTVKGFCIDNRMTGRAAIEALMAAYLFDACESDGKIKFPKRLGSSIVSIPEDDLGAHVSGSARPQTLVKTRTEQWEVPRVIEVEYLDALLVNERVVSVGLTTPPGAPTTGDIYVVGASATGAWSGHDDELATWSGSAWTFVTPIEGWRVFAEDRLAYLMYDGAEWSSNTSASSYLVGVQRASRQAVDTDLVVTVRLPLVMDAAEAARVAETQLRLSWIGRNTSELAVGRKYIQLDPTDIITATVAGAAHRLRINHIKNAGGVLNLSCIDDDVAAYVSTALGIPLPDQPGGLDWRGPTVFHLIDGPLLAEADNTPGLYIVATGVTSAWRGAALYHSPDAGLWNLLARLPSNGIVGVATDELPTVTDPHIWDEGNSVNLFLSDPNDTLTSATESEVLNGANIGILGDEVIQWRNVVAESNGSFTLSGLLRGRKGTEWARSIHAIGDRFAVLSRTQVQFIPLGQSEMYREKFYRAVTFGTQFEDGTDQVFTANAYNMQMLSPVHIKGVRDGSNNLTVTWVRRSRYGGEWVDGVNGLDDVEVPLDDPLERYVVVIVPSMIPYFVTSASFSYTAAMQTGDGITPGDPVTLIVFQRSSYLNYSIDTALIVRGILGRWAQAAVV